MENIQNNFFSNKNIFALNNNILEKLNISNITNKQKQLINSILLKNMKLTWEKIDLNKINNSNIKVIFNQFNTYSLNLSIKEVQNKMNTIVQINNDPSKIKFERDFKSNPQKNVTFLDRSESMLNKNVNNNLNNNLNYTQKLSNKFDPNIDSLFKPLIDNDNQDEPNFNTYNFTKKDGNVKKKLEDILFTRENENYLKKPPKIDVPNFLKSKTTSVRNNESDNNIISNKNNNKNEENEFLFGNIDDTELMSLDNYDKPITNDENYREDPGSFQERLTKLQTDRDNINYPQNKGNIDFSTNDFEDTFDNTFDNIQPTPINKLINRNNQPKQEHVKPRQEYNQSRQEYIQPKQEHIQPKQEYNQPRQEYNQPRQEYNQPRQEYNQPKQEYNDNKKQLIPEHNPNNSVIINQPLSVNEKKEYLKIFSELKNLNKRLGIELKNIKQEKDKLIEEKDKLIEEKDKTDYESIKNDISNEFNKLTLLKEENEFKLKELENKKEEDKMRLIELNKREEEYLIVIDNYNKINKIQNYILEISCENSLSYYIYNFNKIENIMKIKLNSYSIPNILYNIQEDKNNIFEFQINDENKQIIIPSGKYEINDLLTFLNNNEYGILFKLDNITQKIIISHEQHFNILSSYLSFNNLGFTNEYNDNNTYTSNKCFDLRLDNTVYLFLNNIDTSSPFSILIPNGNVNSEIKFENGITLDKLDILFKDSKGKTCNFFGLDHSINLTLEVH